MENSLVEIIDTIDVDPILEAYQKLLPSLTWRESLSGICSYPLQRPWWGIEGRGMVGQMPEVMDEKTGILRKPNEGDFRILDPLCSNTIFEDIIKKYSLVRTRLLKLKPCSTYYMHKDPTLRLHIPLITNPNALFVYRDQCYHFEVGNVYRVDTRPFHTAANFDKDLERLHIVGILGF